MSHKEGFVTAALLLCITEAVLYNKQQTAIQTDQQGPLQKHFMQKHDMHTSKLMFGHSKTSYNL